MPNGFLVEGNIIKISSWKVYCPCMSLRTKIAPHMSLMQNFSLKCLISPFLLEVYLLTLAYHGTTPHGLIMTDCMTVNMLPQASSPVRRNLFLISRCLTGIFGRNLAWYPILPAFIHFPRSLPPQCRASYILGHMMARKLTNV